MHNSFGLLGISLVSTVRRKGFGTLAFSDAKCITYRSRFYVLSCSEDTKGAFGNMLNIQHKAKETDITNPGDRTFCAETLVFVQIQKPKVYSFVAVYQLFHCVACDL